MNNKGKILLLIHHNDQDLNFDLKLRVIPFKVSEAKAVKQQSQIYKHSSRPTNILKKKLLLI